MAVLAHPDDESLGMGSTIAKYASEGVDVFLLTATRGDSGRYRGHRPDDPQHPGPSTLAGIRETELRAAAATLGVREVSLLNYRDQQLDRADPREAVAAIAGHIRRVARCRPHVRTRWRLRASRSHRNLPVHHRRHRGRGRSCMCDWRDRRRAAACGVEAVHTWPGPNRPGALIRPHSGNWCPRLTALNGRRCRGRTGRSPR